MKEIEVPFDIPDSWQWCRIDQLALAKGGKRVPKGMKLQEEENDYPYLRVTDMKNETILDTKIQYAPPQVREVIKNYTISSDDLYITIAGTIGNAGTIPTQFDGALLTENALKLIIYPLVNKMFLLRAINSPAIQNQFLELFNQVAQPKLSIRSTNSTLIPLPPSTEQKRILERLEGVFEVLPKYEISYAELAKLNKEFPEKLRKSILQYAMQGKLVPQDPNDEPVEVLLEKIRQEKQKLFEEGKLKKKDLQESTIYKGDDNSYYEKSGKSEVKLEDVPDLPETWRYARFKDIVHYYMGKTPPRSATEYWGADIPWVSIADMPANGVITDTKEKLSPQATKLFKDKISPIGTLLMSFKLTVGRVSLLGIEAAHNEAIISIFPYADSDKSIKMYLFKFLPQIANNGDSKDAIKGTTLNSQSINELLIPLPPLQEQLRIIHAVEKFDNLIPRLG
ncbi:restriction endonuclease subunit S [Lactococcus sp. LG592]|nr:restriction endonuclease subunit S [Lactococcus sp. LG592]